MLKLYTKHSIIKQSQLKASFPAHKCLWNLIVLMHLMTMRDGLQQIHQTS